MNNKTEPNCYTKLKVDILNTVEQVKNDFRERNGKKGYILMRIKERVPISERVLTMS